MDRFENARAERKTQYAIEEAKEYTERSERLAELSRVKHERRERLNEIEKNRTERIMRKQYMRHILNKQLEKSMTMLSTNAKSDEPFEDYSLFVYRMTAPDFKDRVKHLENKLLYPVSVCYMSLFLWCNLKKMCELLLNMFYLHLFFLLIPNRLYFY